MNSFFRQFFTSKPSMRTQYKLKFLSPVLQLIILASLLLQLWGCEKEEPLYPQPKIAAGLQTATFEMGETYSNQLWFDFESQKTFTNQFGKWDVGFSCSGEPHITICGGKSAFLSVAKITDVDFDHIDGSLMQSLDWKFDNPNGHIDSLAFSGCFAKQSNGYIGKPNETYVIDLGVDTIPYKRYVKMQFLSVRGGVYEFLWSYVLDPQFLYLTKVYTKPDRNYAYFNFSTMQLVENEPVALNEWDLVFTTYKESIPDVNGVMYPYIIRGALINPFKISVAQIDGGIPFDQFNIQDAQSLMYNKNVNEIGYDWKEYSQSASKYTMVPNRYYVIKTINGNYFKMRFIDFYDDKGRKGYPKMAWEILK